MSLSTEATLEETNNVRQYLNSRFDFLIQRVWWMLKTVQFFKILLSTYVSTDGHTLIILYECD